jgi:hypothetical protein
VRESVGEVVKLGGEAEREGAGEGDLVAAAVVIRMAGFVATGVGRGREGFASGEAVMKRRKEENARFRKVREAEKTSHGRGGEDAQLCPFDACSFFDPTGPTVERHFLTIAFASVLTSFESEF